MKTLTRIAREATYAHKAAFDGHATVTRYTDERKSRPSTAISTIILATNRADIVRGIVRSEDLVSVKNGQVEIVALANVREARIIADRVQRVLGCDVANIFTAKF